MTELPSSESIREYAKRTLNIGLAKRVDQLVFEMLMMREYTKSDIGEERMKLENPTVLSIDDSDFCRLLSSVLSKEILQAYGVGLTVVSAEFDEDDIRWNILLEWGAYDE